MKVARPVADLAYSSFEAGMDRKRSRTAFAAQGDASAVQTLRSLFPELLAKPEWSPPQLAAGERITAWKDSNTATITGPDELEATLHSATPIRSSVATGQPKLADISLSSAGSGYAPANPLTPYELSRFNEGGIGVRFADAAPTAAQRTEAKLVYPNAWKDTDLVVAPLPEGFSTTQVLRSAESPERYQVALDLPAGASLEEYRQGGMAFAGVKTPDGGGMRITAPRAIDAAGVAIETSLRVTGANTLEVSIVHRAKDLRYPLQLDPFYLFCNSGCGNYWNEWTYYNPDGNTWSLFNGCYYPPLPGPCDGLWIVPTQANAHPDWYYYSQSAFWYWAGGFNRGERIYRFASGDSAGNGRFGVVVHALYDPASLRFVDGVSYVRGAYPGETSWDTSPWVATPGSFGFHWDYDVDHCFVGVPPRSNPPTTDNYCNLEAAAQANNDLKYRTPIFDYVVWEPVNSGQYVGGMMRWAYAFTVNDLQINPPPPPSTPPETTVDSGPSPVTSDESAEFTFSSSQPGSTFDCRIDSGGWSSCASPKTYANLADGNHTFEVVAVNARGERDLTPARREWRISQNEEPAPGAALTTFEFEPAVPLGDVVTALRGLGLNVTEYTHATQTTVGGFIPPSWMNLDEAAAAYRQDHSRLFAVVASGDNAPEDTPVLPPASAVPAASDPPIISLTIRGAIETATLGDLAPSVSHRNQYAVPHSSEFGTDHEPFIQAEDPGPRGDFPAWSPANGKTNTYNASGGEEAVVAQRIRWNSEESIDAIGPDKAYEHDLKQFNPDYSGSAIHHECGRAQHRFWADRPEKVAKIVWETTLPKGSKPYFDTTYEDPCSVEDLTIGMYHPRQVRPEKNYLMVAVFPRGTKNESPYQLVAQRLGRVCDDNPFCVNPTGGMVYGREGLIGKNFGMAPQCRRWQRDQRTPDRC